MIDKFLKAKHWQLFLPIFGIPMLLQLIFMGIIFIGIKSEDGPNLALLFNYIRIFPVISILFISVFFGWFWSIGVGLDKKIPEDLKLNLGRFKLFLIIPFLYYILVLLFISIAFPSMITMIGIPTGTIMSIILPIHFFAIFCMFHSLYFVAKTIKIAELKRKVTFSDFAGEFFLLWFFPIGVWIVQPKINKMIIEENGYL